MLARFRKLRDDLRKESNACGRNQTISTDDHNHSTSGGDGDHQGLKKLLRDKVIRKVR